MAFHPDFTGDRVYAFVAGLQSMVNHAFDHRREFLLLDDLPTAQFIYNSARNIETACLFVANEANHGWEAYLYADGIQDQILNASYSQLMGK